MKEDNDDGGGALSRLTRKLSMKLKGREERESKLTTARDDGISKIIGTETTEHHESKDDTTHKSVDGGGALNRLTRKLSLRFKGEEDRESKTTAVNDELFGISRRQPAGTDDTGQYESKESNAHSSDDVGGELNGRMTRKISMRFKGREDREYKTSAAVDDSIIGISKRQPIGAEATEHHESRVATEGALLRKPSFARRRQLSASRHAVTEVTEHHEFKESTDINHSSKEPPVGFKRKSSISKFKSAAKFLISSLGSSANKDESINNNSNSSSRNSSINENSSGSESKASKRFEALQREARNVNGAGGVTGSNILIGTIPQSSGGSSPVGHVSGFLGAYEATRRTMGVDRNHAQVIREIPLETKPTQLQQQQQKSFEINRPSIDDDNNNSLMQGGAALRYLRHRKSLTSLFTLDHEDGEDTGKAARSSNVDKRGEARDEEELSLASLPPRPSSPVLDTISLPPRPSSPGVESVGDPTVQSQTDNNMARSRRRFSLSSSFSSSSSSWRRTSPRRGNVSFPVRISLDSNNHPMDIVTSLDHSVALSPALLADTQDPITRARVDAFVRQSEANLASRLSAVVGRHGSSSSGVKPGVATITGSGSGSGSTRGGGDNGLSAKLRARRAALSMLMGEISLDAAGGSTSGADDDEESRVSAVTLVDFRSGSGSVAKRSDVAFVQKKSSSASAAAEGFDEMLAALEESYKHVNLSNSQ